MPELVDSINCAKCGAPLPLATGEVVITCPYCGSLLRLHGETPFLLNHSLLSARLQKRAEAEAAIQGWMSGGFAKPDDLRRHASITALECVYVPFYVFEVTANTRYAGLLTRTGGSDPRGGVLSREYFWKILGRRSDRKSVV